MRIPHHTPNADLITVHSPRVLLPGNQRFTPNLLFAPRDDGRSTSIVAACVVVLSFAVASPGRIDVDRRSMRASMISFIGDDDDAFVCAAFVCAFGGVRAAERVARDRVAFQSASVLTSGVRGARGVRGVRPLRIYEATVIID